MDGGAESVYIFLSIHRLRDTRVCCMRTVHATCAGEGLEKDKLASRGPDSSKLQRRAPGVDRRRGGI